MRIRTSKDGAIRGGREIKAITRFDPPPWCAMTAHIPRIAQALSRH